MAERRKWTAPQERQLLDLIQSKEHTLSWCFMEVARATGRSHKAVAAHYYNQMKSQALPESAEEETSSYSGQRRWTEDEEQILINEVSNNPDNLHACFLAVAQRIDRTPLAVGSHWYTKTSKRDDVLVLITATKNRVSRNRKNGKGVESNPSIWRRLITVLRSLHI